MVRAKQKGLDQVGHSDAIGRERRPYRRGTGSLNKELLLGHSLAQFYTVKHTYARLSTNIISTRVIFTFYEKSHF